jgi:hypothetical protein
MIVLTAFAIGLLSTGMRSLACYVLAGCMIVACFAVAAFVSGGAVPPLALALALVGYNAGIAATVLAALVISPRHQA